MIILSPDADRDLDQISLFIAHDSIDAAMKWLKDLDDFISRIAASPGIGTSREGFRKGMRSTPFGNYLVFFRKVDAGIEVLRVIHGARHWHQEFGRDRSRS